MDDKGGSDIRGHVGKVTRLHGVPRIQSRMPRVTGGCVEAYFPTFTTAGWAIEFQQASKSLASGSPSVTTKR